MFPVAPACAILPDVNADSPAPGLDPTGAAAGHFVLFGAMHLFILFATAALPLALALWARRAGTPAVGARIAATLAGILACDRLLAVGWAWHTGKIAHWPDALPMHLCDWATFVVIYALLAGGQRAYETAYFWGLAGTFQAVLTPDTKEVFPSPLFLSFFVGHCGIIVGVLFLTWGRGQRPGRDRFGEPWAGRRFTLVAAGATNWLLGTNFGYLAAKPRNASLLDFFAPWPWYVLELEVICIVLYGLLYLPFVRRGPRHASRSSASGDATA